MDEENKVVLSYSITRYENGDVVVDNVEVEGVEKQPVETLYKDIEDLADTLKMKRIEAAVIRGVHRYMSNLAASGNSEE